MTDRPVSVVSDRGPRGDGAAGHRVTKSGERHVGGVRLCTPGSRPKAPDLVSGALLVAPADAAWTRRTPGREGDNAQDQSSGGGPRRECHRRARRRRLRHRRELSRWQTDADLVHQPRPDPSGRAPRGAFGQAGIAERVHGPPTQYTIEVQLLPQSATEQREQLLRRLAAEDSSIDLMSLDPPFIRRVRRGRLPRAGPRRRRRAADEGRRRGRRSRARPGTASSSPSRSGPTPSCSGTASRSPRRPGLDMTKPVTWDQIIDGGAGQDEARSACRAPSTRATRVDQRPDRVRRRRHRREHRGATPTRSSSDSSPEAGEAAADGHAAASASPAVGGPGPAPPPDEGTAATGFEGGHAGFHGQLALRLGRPLRRRRGRHARPVRADDIGWALYPRGRSRASRAAPPYGGINLGVGAFSEHADLRLRGRRVHHLAENQAYYFVDQRQPGRQTRRSTTTPTCSKEFPMAPT